MQLPPTYDEVNAICKDVLDEIVGQTGYNHAEAVKWNQKAVETISGHLVALGRPFKFCGELARCQNGFAPVPFL